MSASDRVGWWTICFLTLLGLVFGVAGLVHGAELSLRDRVALAVPVFGSRREPVVDAGEFADAVAAVPHVTREWAALLLTVGSRESALSARIARGECRPRECDHGLAWGVYQQHANALNGEAWGSTDLAVQTQEAARALRRAFYRCQRGPLRADWVARTFSAYAGRQCDAVWPGLGARLATYSRVLRAL